MQSQTLQRYAFCVNPARFSLFFLSGEGHGGSFFVNESKCVSSWGDCIGLCVWCFSCNALSSSGLYSCKGLLIDIGGVFGG